MMVFVLVGLGVFMVVRFITEAIEAPSWFVVALSIVLATAGMALTSESAWWGPATAGIAFGFYRADQLVQALRDWIRVQVLRGPSRR
jgi:hypothetical protein